MNVAQIVKEKEMSGIKNTENTVHTNQIPRGEIEWSVGQLLRIKNGKIFHNR